MADMPAADLAVEMAVTGPADAVAGDGLAGDGLAGDALAADVLVEEVSIDGMCGVY